MTRQNSKRIGHGHNLASSTWTTVILLSSLVPLTLIQVGHWDPGHHRLHSTGSWKREFIASTCSYWCLLHHSAWHLRQSDEKIDIDKPANVCGYMRAHSHAKWIEGRQRENELKVHCSWDRALQGLTYEGLSSPNFHTRFLILTFDAITSPSTRS